MCPIFIEKLFSQFNHFVDIPVQMEAINTVNIIGLLPSGIALKCFSCEVSTPENIQFIK